MLEVPDFYREEDQKYGSIWKAIKAYALMQGEFGTEGVELDLIDIHKGDSQESLLPFLDVLSNAACKPKSKGRRIIMRVKQGHSET